MPSVIDKPINLTPILASTGIKSAPAGTFPLFVDLSLDHFIVLRTRNHELNFGTMMSSSYSPGSS